MAENGFDAVLNAGRRIRSVKGSFFETPRRLSDEDGDDVRNPSAGLTSLACSVLLRDLHHRSNLEALVLVELTHNYHLSPSAWNAYLALGKGDTHKMHR